MKEIVYYTDKEAQNKLMELFTQGKGLFALKDDPKCPLDIKEKLETLSNLHKEAIVQIMSDKVQEGGVYGDC